jgi:hypothetical protein
MKKSHAAILVILLAALFVLLRAASTPPWPDDWDGIGFVESVTRFDLDHFVPHPPGYPVYVALLRLAALGVPRPQLAANLVAIQCGVAATLFAFLAASRALGRSRAVWIALLIAVAPLAWRTGTSVGSEGPALMFACAAVAGATLEGSGAAWCMGVAIGLGLGVRLSWAPLFVAMIALAPRGERMRTSAVATLATLAWCVPFVWLVGPRHLASLAMTHAAGHFHVWGGTAIEEPGLMRAVWLARDLFVDGLGVDSDAIGIAIAIVIVMLTAVGFSEWRENGFPHARLLWLLAPYAAWITLGQNIHQQPRHALPLVVALVAALALAASGSRNPRTLGVALVGLLAMRTSSDANLRATAPAGEQLVVLADSSASQDRQVAVFAGASTRFFELAPNPNVTAVTVATFGDAELALGHLPSIPSRILVTGELEGLPRAPRSLVPLTKLCRDPRVDRRAPCLDVYEWRPALPAH